MKKLYTLCALAIATLAHAQDGIPVYLNPTTDSPQIGELETLSLAVPAEWPEGSESQPGWQPVYYHDTFEVYVDNNDVGKDLNPKPGSLYYLAPEKSAATLSVATEKDRTDILGVDVWFTKMQLETILVAYIEDSSSAGQSLANEAEAADLVPSTPPPAAGTSVTELVGRLEKTGMLVRNRSGLKYKLVGPDGKVLALVDTSKLPELAQLDNHLSKDVRLTGVLQQIESSNHVAIIANKIRPAN